MIPDNLRDWTYDTVKELAGKKFPESDRHDFKLGLPDADTLTKIACAYANSKGGYVIFGVKDGTFDIIGNDRDPEISHKFGQKIKANPTVYFEPPKIIEIPSSSKIIPVFYIPFSQEGPHIPEHRDKRYFWKRTNTGCEGMSYEEIRMAFQHLEERREKIKLLYLELLLDREKLIELVVPDDQIRAAYPLVALDDSIINRLLVELYTSFFAGDNELVLMLYKIRSWAEIINNKAKIFFAEISLPMTGKESLVENYNLFLRDKVNLLRPFLERAINILESRYGLTNPLLPRVEIE